MAKTGTFKPVRTQPSTGPAGPAGPVAPSRQTQRVKDPTTRRVQLILKNGGKWMPPQTIFALAASGLNETDLIATTKQIRASTVRGFHEAGIKADDGFKFLTDDPVLEKRTSAALALKRYLNGAIGPWPVKDDDLAHIQTQLQKKGYGADLSIDGAWNTEWDAAYRQWTHQLVTSQLSGNQPGSSPIGTALHFLGSVLPKEAGNATIGFIKGLPHAARQLTADLVEAGVGSTVGMFDPNRTRPGDVAAGFVMGQTPEEYASSVEGKPVEFGKSGHAVYPEGEGSFAHHVGRYLDDAGTLLLAHSALKAGSSVSKAIGEGLLKRGAAEATTAEAQRAGGVISRTLAANAGTAAERTPGAIGGMVGKVGGGLQRAGTETAVFRNIPGLARVGGVIGDLADAEGLYYKARTLVATPYRFTPVAAAGTALSEVGIFGAKARGVAAVAGRVDPDTELSGISDEHVLDTVDDAVKHRLDFTLFGHHIQPHLDDLAFFLHGPVHGPGSMSNRVGDHVDGIVETAIDTLGEVGIEAQIERATGMSTDAQMAALGGPDRWVKFWSDKVNKYAADFYAEKTVTRGFTEAGEPLVGLDYRRALRDASHEARQNPEILATARRELIAQRGGEELALRIHREIQATRTSSKGWLQGHGSDFLDASEIVTKKLLPYFHPDALHPDAPISDLAEAAHYGIARNETLTRQGAHRLANDLQAEADDLAARVFAANDARKAQSELVELTAEQQAALRNAPTFEEEFALEEKINDALFEHFGVHGDAMPHDLPEKIGKMRDFANDLASDVYLPSDEVTAMHNAMGELNVKGYKLVSGRDIGWLHVPETPVDLLDGGLKFRRKVAEAIGLNPNAYGGLHIGAYRRVGIRNAIQDLVDAGSVTHPPWWTTDSLMKYLQQEAIMDTPATGLVGRLTRVPKKAVNAILERESDLTRVEAEARARAEISGALQLRDVPRSRVIEVLTDPHGFDKFSSESYQKLAREAADGAGELHVPPYTTKEAEQIYRAIVKGSAAPKAYMLGASRIDDLFRASMGFAGNGLVGRTAAGAAIGGVAGAINSVRSGDRELDDVLRSTLEAAGVGGVVAAAGGEKLGWWMANLPNDIVRLRNQLRFDLSPYFSFRRIAKTNAKLGIEGVAPSLRPLDAMEKAGTLVEDRAVLRRVYPELVNDISDDADRYLRENDVFGFYNARNYEAYAAGQWARKGLSDAEIHDKLVKTFAYGSRKGEGRSAIERTANFVFFPFSFDKTLYRNFGGYLLDRPGQLMLLTRGLAAYHQFNETHLDGSNPLASSWWEKHVPVLEEALRLNAFAHGISAGEFGGINRPLLNVFLPQSWASSSEANATLRRYIPAIQDFQRILANTVDQGHILHNLSVAMWRDFKETPDTFANPRPSTLTRDAQIEDAFAMQRQWFTTYQELFTYNERHPDKPVRFPADKQWGEFAGETVNKSNVNRIIARKYPAFNPNLGGIKAVLSRAEVQDYVRSVKGTERGTYIARLFDNAEKLNTLFNRPDTSVKDVAKYTENMRAAAAWLAERDPDFYRMYQKHLRRSFGPLEEVR